jgi:hypothetical protein
MAPETRHLKPVKEFIRTYKTDVESGKSKEELGRKINDFLENLPQCSVPFKLDLKNYIIIQCGAVESRHAFGLP